jgi:glycosyltransferase involved in cell wall biosynthesis
MNGAKPFVSILIPVFNGLEFLEDCLKSVVVQTFQDWEVLIGLNGHGLNGGDTCQKILDILAGLKDMRIRLIVQGPPLQGKVESINALLDDARGSWIALLDCDDIWLPTKLDAQLSTLFGPAAGADIVGTACRYFGYHQGSPTLPTGWITRHHLLEANPIINSSVMIRTEVCRKLKWRYTEICWGMEDYDFWIRAELAGLRMWNMSEQLVLHRIHPASAFNTKTQDPRPLQHAYVSGNL